jgi:predicted DNA binding protein
MAEGMWELKLELRHDCIIGDRCKKYKCTSTGYPLDFYTEKGSIHYLHFEKINGDTDAVKAFIADLEKEKNMVKFEAHGNTIFFIFKERKKGKMPGQLSLASKKIFHSKPVFVDKDGIEHWEVVGWRREDINAFIRYIKEKTHGLHDFKIIKIVKTKVSDLFFPQLMPHITTNQKKALDVAIAEGYYNYPRHIELADLAKMMKISLSTYREHLRKAEKAVMPNLQQNMISL